MSNSTAGEPPVPQDLPLLLTQITHRFRILREASPIYEFLLSTASITSASPGRVTARLTLQPQHLNSKGGLHGAVSAAFVDCFGGLAIVSHDGRERTGASVDINVSYLGTAGAGEEVEIEGCVDKVGGSLAFTSVTVSRLGAEGREVLVRGRHTKFVRGTAPGPVKDRTGA